MMKLRVNVQTNGETKNIGESEIGGSQVASVMLEPEEVMENMMVVLGFCPHENMVVATVISQREFIASGVALVAEAGKTGGAQEGEHGTTD